MNLYTKLFFQHERHVYKRGAYTGDAPADSRRRAKTHFRIVKRDGSMGVIFHSTQIIIAYADGRVMLNARGWQNTQTTRAAFYHFGIPITSKWNNGYRNTMVQVNGQSYVYYDNMMFDSSGALMTPPALEYKYEADKEARAVFKEDAKPFLDVMPVLLATSKPRIEAMVNKRNGWYAAQRHYEFVRERTVSLLERQAEEEYSEIVDAWQGYAYDEVEERVTAKQLWSALYRKCTQDMRSVVAVAQA